jgi:hypothetical protein
MTIKEAKKRKQPINKLAHILKSILVLTQELEQVKKDIQTLAKFTHHHPTAPILGQVAPNGSSEASTLSEGTDETK